MLFLWFIALLGLAHAQAPPPDAPLCEEADRKGLIRGPNGAVFFRGDHGRGNPGYEPKPGYFRVLDALHAKGVRVAVAYWPPRALAYAPEEVPAKPPAYFEQGAEAYRRHLERLRGHATPVDLLSLLRGMPGGPYLPRESHLSPEGAKHLARGLAPVLRALADREGLEPVTWELGEGDTYDGVPSRILREVCDDPVELGEVSFVQPTATRVSDDVAAALLGDPEPPRIALTGRSMLGPRYGLGAHLRLALGADLSVRTTEGGGPIIPLLNEIDAERWDTNPPDVLVWFLTVNQFRRPTNRSSLGFDDPLSWRRALGHVHARCDASDAKPLRLEDATEARLPVPRRGPEGPGASVQLDLPGAESAEVTLELTYADGFEETLVLQRHTTLDQHRYLAVSLHEGGHGGLARAKLRFDEAVTVSEGTVAVCADPALAEL